MRSADQMTITDFGMPGFTLMETAGRGAADLIARHFGAVKGLRICCLCGKGNNGGDGLVVGRHLSERGAKVMAHMVLGTENLSEDARVNLAIVERLAAEAPAQMGVTVGPPSDLDRYLDQYDVLVDALLGTGLEKALREPLSSVVESVNRARARVVALDVPTGINGDSGEVLGAAVRATLTVTMGGLKRGLLVGEGPDYTGRVEVVDIGVPAFILRKAAELPPGPTYLPEHDDIVRLLPRRPRRAHKYSAGLVLVVSGSPDLSGAPVMASTAAARSGAGAVVCAAPESVQATLAAKLTEVMTLALPAGDAGISAEGALTALSERLRTADALLVGPGLGRQGETGRFVRQLLESTELPTVIDADGLYHLADTTDTIAAHSNGRWILTPHLGELRRLAGDEVIGSDPVETARHLAKSWNCVLVFKGAPTVVASPDGRAFINPTGNQALATAGSGDVLAGMIAGFLAQGLSPADAALCALYVGGTAVERISQRGNADSTMAMDIVGELADALAVFRP